MPSSLPTPCHSDDLSKNPSEQPTFVSSIASSNFKTEIPSLKPNIHPCHITSAPPRTLPTHPPSANLSIITFNITYYIKSFIPTKTLTKTPYYLPSVTPSKVTHKNASKLYHNISQKIQQYLHKYYCLDLPHLLPV